MLKVGLTGGIGCGKSTVCRLFADLGVPIIDADVIARQLVEPGRLALRELSEIFGAEILEPDGCLNRAALRQIVFADEGRKRQLDGVMHPLIYREIENQVGRLSAPYCMLAIPLLVEAGWQVMVDRVLLVDCPPALQLQRVMQRDRVTADQAGAIMAAQADRAQRLAAAHDVIDNAFGPECLAEQVKNLHNSYLLLATARTTSA